MCVELACSSGVAWFCPRIPVLRRSKNTQLGEWAAINGLWCLTVSVWDWHLS